MKTDRRYHLFNDYLRERFGERLQRVTLSGGLVCAHPMGREECPFCREAVTRDPGWGRGAPPHEQIRRGINFSRRRGESSPRLQVAIPAPAGGASAPIDHVQATIDMVAQDEHVAVVSIWTALAAVDEELAAMLGSYAGPEREVWLEMDDTPDAWPIERRDSLRLGVQVDLGLGPAPGANGHSAELAADRVRRLDPDAVGIVAPAFLAGTEAGARYQSGALDEPDLEEFAERAARFLERIPERVTVHPLVLFSPNDAVLGPHWVLNRQKVEAAVAEALEARGTVQGEKA